MNYYERPRSYEDPIKWKSLSKKEKYEYAKSVRLKFLNVFEDKKSKFTLLTIINGIVGRVYDKITQEKISNNSFYDSEPETILLGHALVGGTFDLGKLEDMNVDLPNGELLKILKQMQACLRLARIKDEVINQEKSSNYYNVIESKIRALTQNLDIDQIREADEAFMDCQTAYQALKKTLLFHMLIGSSIDNKNLIGLDLPNQNLTNLVDALWKGYLKKGRGKSVPG
ncbi:MAG: hypothetical protein GF332_02865 [Candidatus Moranbacteria bacterium]|nr:hypothetical protein [Candidatus Moranbacteria bacterium]